MTDLETRLVAAVNRKDVSGARELFGRLPLASQKSAQGNYLAGMIARLGGHTAHAITCFEASLRQQPMPQVWQALGVLHNDGGDLDGARDALRKAVALAPGYLEAWVNLGRVEVRREDYGQALAAFAAANRLKPTGSAIIGEVQALLATGEVDRALERGRAAVHVAPQLPRCHLALSTAFGATGAWADAAATLEAAGAAKSTDPEFVRALAQASYRAGEAARAVEVLRGAINRLGPMPGLVADLSRIEYTEGVDDPLASYRDALASAPADLDLLTAFVSFAALAERTAEARDIVLAAVAQGRDDPSFLAAAAYFWRQDGDLDRAVAIIEEAMAKPAGHHSAGMLGTACALFLEAGKSQGALDAADALLAIRPQDQAGIAYRAEADRQLGQPAPAEVAAFAQYQVIETPIGYGSLQAFNAALAKDLTSLHRAVREPIDQSLRGGSQVELVGMAHRYETIGALVAALKKSVATYIQQLEYVEDHPFLGHIPSEVEFSGIWSVRLKGGGQHVNHVHPDGWLSSCYYVSVPPTVRDSADHAGWLRLGELPFDAPGDVPTVDFEPKPGHLALFPSYRWHGTIPFDDEEPRLTVAFDVKPGGGLPRSPSQ